MPIYICPRCRYKSKIKTHMMNHFNRKRKCKITYNNITTEECIIKLKNIKKSKITVPVKKKNIKPYYTSSSSEQQEKINNNFCCPKCNKHFTRHDNMRRHQKNCKNINEIAVKEEKNVYTKSEVDTLVENINSEHDLKDQINQAIIQELRHQINLLMQNQGSNITYNTNIMLNAFGQENTKYIDNKFIKNIIKKGPLNSISLLLQHLHFNPEHTENHNIMIPNKKSTFAKIYNGENWQISDKKKTIDDMTDKAYAMINEHYTGDNTYMDDFKDKYDSQNSIVNKKVQRDTEIMILNS